ncbi:MAG TPA: DNA primase [Dehalococcoidia bacterium]
MNDNAIETVRQRVDIVELVGEQVQLQKSGRNFKANCPFHSEKTPSFYVYPERQTWHCFGACATGGDVFSFVMTRENAGFGEALRTLAERAGVVLEKTRPDESSQPRDRLIAANEAAIAYFRQALQGSSAGEEARAYVARRGLDAPTVAVFELGFAPDGWDNLRSYLLEKGFSEEEQLEAGLLTTGERGSPYDRFRRRLIFPIRDDRGRAVGFGGRALDDAKPKYLNTPQTPLFDKGNLLFLLDRAKDAIRGAGEAVVVEGYLDAITAHQFGYANVVATLGTAITERHVQLLKRLSHKVTLCMDADAAGQDAALRGEEVARTLKLDDGAMTEAVVAWDGLVRVQARSPIELRVFTVPSGKDPDEAIREDTVAWPAWVAAAMPPFEFRLRREEDRTNMNDPRARVELADRMLPLLLQIGDQALQASYIAKLAGKAAVSPETLRARLRTLLPNKAAGQPLPARERVSRPLERPESAQRREDKVEAFTLALLLRHPNLREAGEALAVAMFHESAHREIFAAWRRSAELDAASLPEELRYVYSNLQEQRMPPFDAPSAELALIDAVQQLRLRQISEQKRLVTAELAEMQSEVGPQAATGRTMEGERATSATTDGESEPSLAIASHMRADEYLMRELHALEWEKRTHRTPRWAGADVEHENSPKQS